jgi:hypothetical protein
VLAAIVTVTSWIYQELVLLPPLPDDKRTSDADSKDES